MHSSIQFRHKAISTYTWRRLQSLWLFRSNTLLADSDMCLGFFWGHFCRWKLDLRFHVSLGLVYISLSFTSSGLSPPIVVTKSFLSPRATVTISNWKQFILCATVIFLLLKDGPWGWMCRSCLGGHGPQWNLLTPFPPPVV